MNHWSFTTFITIVTIYALFGEDFKILFFDKSVDDTFNIITIISLVSFTFEIVFSSIAIDGYFLGFYFWLDFISTVRIILSS